MHTGPQLHTLAKIDVPRVIQLRTEHQLTWAQIAERFGFARRRGSDLCQLVRRAQRSAKTYDQERPC